MTGSIMLFAMHAIDAPDAARPRYCDDHKAHLKRAPDYGVKLVIGGPLVGVDGQSVVGSLMVFEAGDRASVERYNADDPFWKNGVWSTVHIAQFDRRT